MTLPTTKCGGCRKSFPRLSGDQCPKCQELESHRVGSAQHRSIMEYPQCMTCGSEGCLQYLDALSKENAPNPHPPRGAAQSDAQKKRSETLFEKLTSGSAPASRPPGGTQLNIADLEKRATQLRDLASVSKKDLIPVVLDIRVGSTTKKSSIDDRYGSCRRAFDPTTTLIDIQDWGVDQVNMVHKKTKGNQPIEASETVLRLIDNQPIEDGRMGLTLTRFKNVLINEGFLDESGGWIFKKGKGTKKAEVAGKPALLFELFVFFDMVRALLYIWGG
ncbi:hypothetical protein NMY22_g19639 [Coprinellus aureogranulatus]|nr:hypothetical protein NMY22_g19639 [Coprinellus aureogranulatus]